MEPPASNRLGLAEPVSRTEGNKPSPASAARRCPSGIHRRGSARSRRTGRPGQIFRPVDALVQQLAESARAHSGAAMSVCALGGYGRAVARPALRHRPPHPLRGRDGAERGALRRCAAPAALGPRADRRPARPRARRVRRAGGARFGERRIPPRRCSTSGSSPATSGSFSGSTAGCAVSAPTTAGACSMRCCSSSTSATRRSTTRSISSSLTSRARPAGCGTSRRPGTSGCSARRDRQRVRSRRRVSWRMPRTSSSASARFCTSRAGRDVNVLTHELQERVAEMFGCEGRQSQQRVETLMGDYFRARAIVVAGARAGPARGDAAGRHERLAPRRPAL